MYPTTNCGWQDIKPSNIGVSADNDVRLLDFGLARAKAEIMTGYVTTRHCRAPEIMLNWMHYTQKGLSYHTPQTSVMYINLALHTHVVYLVTRKRMCV